MLAVSAVAVLGLPPLDAAIRDDVRRDVTVRIADLDLASPEGGAALDRIRAAARKARGLAHVMDAKANNDMHRCRAEAVRRAYYRRQMAAR